MRTLLKKCKMEKLLTMGLLSIVTKTKLNQLIKSNLIILRLEFK